MSIIGDLIKYYRKQLNMSQQDLCGEECSRRSLINIENGRNIPSLETIAIFSSKLRVNLFGAYCSVYANNDLQTHLLCKEIDTALSAENTKELKSLIKKAEKEKGFSSGEPMQMLCYVRGLIEFYNRNYSASKKYYEEGIGARHPEFPRKMFDGATYNNKEYAMLMAYAVTVAKLGETTTSLFLLKKEEEYVANLLNLKDYLDEGTKGFLNNVRCSCLVNEYCIQDEPDERFLERIDSVIEMQKETQRMHLLSNLLFCKAAILMKAGETNNAKEIYKTAYAISEFYYGKGRAKKQAKELINVHSDYSLFEK